MNKKIEAYMEQEKTSLISMADQIYDRPEMAFHEEFASTTLENYLEKKGFCVQRGLGSLSTAFRAEYGCGKGKRRIGLLCEYDALPSGHACGHHMQGPAIVGAAAAVKELLKDKDYELIVYGTPAEEGKGGKVTMLEEGYLKDIDVALMMHGGPATQTDIRSMAKISAKVTYHGHSSHAALKPEAGRSALDALLLAFQGIEFMREHVKEDTRMHYTVSNAGGPCNVVPETAVGEFGIRSYDSCYLDELISRFENVVNGAAMMTETKPEIQYAQRLEGKIPNRTLNAVLMKYAELYNAPNRKPDREKTGSTDFANVLYHLPGACIRIAFVPDGTSSHSQGFLDAGKTEEAHEAVMLAAKILTSACIELINNDDLMNEIQEEFLRQKSPWNISSI